MTDTPFLRRLLHALRPTRRRVALGVTAGLLFAGLYWWYDGGRYMFIPRRLGTVEDGVIYRSAQIHRRLIEDVLVEHGVQVIIDMEPDDPADPDETTEREVAAALGVRKIDIAGLDGSGRGDPNAYVRVLGEMVRAKQTGTPILVHCAAGTQRTGAAVAMYRMLFQDWSGARAFEEYMSYRRHRPDGGKLERYLETHFPNIAQELVKTGALPSVPDPLPRFGPDGASR
ncbi:MAG: tyrosine-protein phosphatase [Planctomycetota bacterium]|nr:tyrosine-protein phosphatase [Planctomycetota bacterium]